MNQLEENRGSSKTFWCNLKQLGMPTKPKNSQSSLGFKMANSDNIVFDRKTVANKFNDFFCNIAAKLVEKLNKRSFNVHS